MTDHSMDTPNVASHPLEDYWTPERLAQRDRLAALLHSVELNCGGSGDWRDHRGQATRLMPEVSERSCPHCKFTASEIGGFHITAQETYAGTGVRPSDALVAARVGPDEGLRAWYRTVLDSASQSVDQKVAGRVEVDYSALVRLDPNFPGLLAAIKGSAE